MIALFKQKSPANIVLLLIFGMLIKLPVFLHPGEIAATPQDGKLYHWLLSWLLAGTGRALAGAALAFLLLYVQALMLNYIINEYRMTSRQTFLPALSYLLVTSLLPEWSYLSAALVAATFVIWGFGLTFRLYNVASANGRIYNIGLVMGLATFCFFPSVFFAVCILLGLLVLRPLRLNELLLSLVGMATPYYFYAIYLFLNDRLTVSRLFPEIDVQLPDTLPSLWLVGSTLLLCIPFLIGGYYVQGQLRRMLIQARKNWSLVLFYLLLALFIPFVNGTGTFENWMLAAAPFAAFHACAYLYPANKWLSPLLFFLTVAFIVAQQYVLPRLA